MTHFTVPDVTNRLWTTQHAPVLVVGSGDEISFEAREVAGGYLDEFVNGDTPVAGLDLDLVYPLVGPIMVDGARRGDVIQLEVLDYQPGDWGWTAILAGLGLLPSDFPDPRMYRWDLTSHGADFLGAAMVPIRPFLGVMAVTPDVIEPTGVFPPGNFGGNIDCRDLTVGSSVFLPVQTDGGRVMLGDPHAAQGDGEVCGTALEASMAGRLRMTLHEDRAIAAPQFATPGPLRRGIDDQGHFATMGIAPDLMTASQDAVKYMVEHISSTYGLDPADAYMLSSVAVDLKISEVVDAPNWVVSAYLPTSVMN